MYLGSAMVSLRDRAQGIPGAIAHCPPAQSWQKKREQGVFHEMETMLQRSARILVSGGRQEDLVDRS